MSGTKIIRTQAPPEGMETYPKVDIFVEHDFNQALWENGYNCLLEEAIMCPCKGDSSDNRATCDNCMGMGWVFVNPIKTRAFINSINRSTKYKDWSPEMIGTVAVTFRHQNRFGFMWKITMTENYGMISEVLDLRTGHKPGYQNFVFGTYPFHSIDSVFAFNGDNSPLIKIKPSDYQIADNHYVLNIKNTDIPAEFNKKVTVTYRHKVIYHVIDIPHDIRITKYYDDNGTRRMQEMPVQAIARKAQYELASATNYAGNNVFDNSYLTH